MLLAHLMRAAASRTFWTAGTRSPIKMAMMAMTTNSSIRVKARPRIGLRSFSMTVPRDKIGLERDSKGKTQQLQNRGAFRSGKANRTQRLVGVVASTLANELDDERPWQ